MLGEFYVCCLDLVLGVGCWLLVVVLLFVRCCVMGIGCLLLIVE